MSSFSVAPTLLENDKNAITVAWPRGPPTAVYELAMMEAGSGEWRSLSASLKASQARKKNLDASKSYCFKIRSKASDDVAEWGEWSDETAAITPLTEAYSLMNAPVMTGRDASSVTLGWSEVFKADGYRIKFRADGETTWTELGGEGHLVAGLAVKKKGLLKQTSYYFSVLPVGDGLDGQWSWSLSSPAFQVTDGLSPFLKSLFPATLHSKKGVVQTEVALEGKVVAVYFSAHWCGPCRQFTPALAEVYNQARIAGKPFEVVFCSADHSEEEMKSYYDNSHPWLAIDFEDPVREAFMGKFEVKGIPQLTILKPTGEIIIKNAREAGGVSAAAIDYWIAQSGL